MPKSKSKPIKRAAWKNTSHYSKGQEDQSPNEFTLKFGAFSIILHRHVHYPPDVWLFSFLDSRAVELKSKNVIHAKMEAIAIVRGILQRSLDALGAT